MKDREDGERRSPCGNTAVLITRTPCNPTADGGAEPRLQFWRVPRLCSRPGRDATALDGEFPPEPRVSTGTLLRFEQTRARITSPRQRRSSVNPCCHARVDFPVAGCDWVLRLICTHGGTTPVLFSLTKSCRLVISSRNCTAR